MPDQCGNCAAAVSRAWARVYSVDGVVFCCPACSTGEFRTRPDMELVREIVATDECPDHDLTRGAGPMADSGLGGVLE